MQHGAEGQLQCTLRSALVLPMFSMIKLQHKFLFYVDTVIYHQWFREKKRCFMGLHIAVCVDTFWHSKLPPFTDANKKLKAKVLCLSFCFVSKVPGFLRWTRITSSSACSQQLKVKIILAFLIRNPSDGVSPIQASHSTETIFKGLKTEKWTVPSKLFVLLFTKVNRIS